LPRFAKDGWSWFNPTVAVDDSGVHILVRTANYTIQPNHRYAVFDRDTIIRSQYVRLRLDHELALRELTPIADRSSIENVTDFPVNGFEDGRLIRHNDYWHVFASIRNLNASGVCQQILLRLEGDSWL